MMSFFVIVLVKTDSLFSHSLKSIIALAESIQLMMVQNFSMPLSVSLPPMLPWIGHILIFACIPQNIHLGGIFFPLIAISCDDLIRFQGMLFLGGGSLIELLQNLLFVILTKSVQFF